MIEAAIGIPFLLVILAGLADILVASTTYMSLSQIARAEAVMAGQMPDITGSHLSVTPNNISEPDVRVCFSADMKVYNPYNYFGCAQRVMEWRFWRLLTSNRVRLVAGTETMNLERVCPSNLITVTVSGTYAPIFFLFKGVTLTARANGSYFPADSVTNVCP